MADSHTERQAGKKMVTDRQAQAGQQTRVQIHSHQRTHTHMVHTHTHNTTHGALLWSFGSSLYVSHLTSIYYTHPQMAHAHTRTRARTHNHIHDACRKHTNINIACTQRAHAHLHGRATWRVWERVLETFAQIQKCKTMCTSSFFSQGLVCSHNRYKKCIVWNGKCTGQYAFGEIICQT
jgi:hypothetical protein